MGLFTREEFAKLAGISKNKLNVCLHRGKVIAVGKRQHLRIDSEHPINREFIQKEAGGLDLSRLNEKSELDKKVERNQAKAVKKTKEDLKKGQDVSFDVKNYIDSDKNFKESAAAVKKKKDLDELKTKAQIEKLEAEVRIKHLEEKRMMGESLPTDKVKDVISELSRQILRTYAEKIEKFAIEFSHKNKLNVEQTAEMRGELKSMINDAHDDAINNAKKQIKRIVIEVTGKKK